MYPICIQLGPREYYPYRVAQHIPGNIHIWETLDFKWHYCVCKFVITDTEEHNKWICHPDFDDDKISVPWTPHMQQPQPMMVCLVTNEI